MINFNNRVKRVNFGLLVSTRLLVVSEILNPNPTHLLIVSEILNPNPLIPCRFRVVLSCHDLYCHPYIERLMEFGNHQNAI